MRLIAHQIHKNQGSDIILKHFSDQLIPADDFAKAFIDDIRKAIGQKNPLSGKFARPAGSQPPLEQRLNRYLADPSDEEFIAMSIDLADHLCDLLENVLMASGGYLVFAEHEHAGDAFLLLLILSTKAKAAFTDNLQLQASNILDLEHMRHAARVLENEVASNSDGVVKFVSRESQGVAHYFLNFLGCERVSDSTEQGRLLRLALTKVATVLGCDVEEVNQTAYNLWRQCRQDRVPMKMTTLANIISPGDPDRVLGVLTDESLGLAGEFDAPPASVMNKLVKFSYHSTSLRLDFDKKQWIDLVTVSSNGRAVTIKDAPPDLIKQINDAKNPNILDTQQE